MMSKYDKKTFKSIFTTWVIFKKVYDLRILKKIATHPVNRIIVYYAAHVYGRPSVSNAHELCVSSMIHPASPTNSDHYFQAKFV